MKKFFAVYAVRTTTIDQESVQILKAIDQFESELEAICLIVAIQAGTCSIANKQFYGDTLTILPIYE